MPQEDQVITFASAPLHSWLDDSASQSPGVHDEVPVIVSEEPPEGATVSPHYLAWKNSDVSPDLSKNVINSFLEYKVSWDGKLFVRSRSLWIEYTIPSRATFVLGDYVELVSTSLGPSESMDVGSIARIVGYSVFGDSFIYYLESESETGFVSTPDDLKKAPEGYHPDDSEVIPKDISLRSFGREVRAYLNLRRNFKRNISKEINQINSFISKRDQDNIRDKSLIKKLEDWRNEPLISKKGVIENAFSVYPIVDSLYYNITFNPDCIDAITNPLVCFFRDAKINFGNIRVNINYRKEPTFYSVRKESYTVFGEDEKMVGSIFSVFSPEYFHPHIKPDGRACFGTFDDTINEFLRDRNYLELLRVVHQYLISPAPGDSFSDVTGWVTNKDEICHRCYEKGCRHMTGDSSDCSYCGEDEDNCTCWHCPNSGDNLEGMSGRELREYCAECDNYNPETDDRDC